MALPRFTEARNFYQAALQRLDDSRALLHDDPPRTTAAVYLAGYAVECMLKALLLASISNARERGAMLDSFRGRRAHDFSWLRVQYLRLGGPAFPLAIARDFARVNTWSTDLRYKPGTIRLREAVEFLRAVERILEWADGRI